MALGLAIKLGALCLSVVFSADDVPSRSQLDISITRLLASQRNSEALALVESFLTANPDDSQTLFDAARITSRMGDGRQSAAYAIRAIRAGWLDDSALDNHGDLANLRAHEAWSQVLQVRKVLRDSMPALPQPDRTQPTPGQEKPAPPRGGELREDKTARRALKQWLAKFGGGRYRIETHSGLNLLIASAIDRDSLDRAIAMLERLSPVLSQLLFTQPPQEAVLLVVATPADGEKYFGNPNNDGSYDHGDRRLITRDTGGSLRHEFTHLMHYGDMERRQQHHPIWILEGIGALFEEWRPGPAGEVMILPNMRSNEAFDLVRRKQSVPWAEFFRIGAEKFMADPQWNYAQARSIFMYMADRGKLSEFYRTFVKGFGSDPTGRRALEIVFDAPVGRIEDQWKAWVLAKGKQDVSIDDGDGVMGVSISEAPDGVRLDSVQPGAPAQKAGMRVGDVITQIEDADIRSVGDYLLHTASRKAGENVRIRFRRGDVYSIVRLTLASGHEAVR